MRSKFIALLLCFCLLIPAAAEARELPASDDVLTALSKQSGFDSLQSWIDETLSASVGAGAENVVLAAAALHPELDFSRYVSSALEKLSGSASQLSPATVQYIIHVLFRLGVGSGALSVYVPEKPEDKGIMSLIYAIHLADDGIVSDGDALRDKLISLRHPDGGWSIFGEVSDVDVTAMALQALFREGYEEFSNAAFDCLASKQLEDGGFKSFGEENCESLSQVIMALVAHGTDHESSELFIKNGSGVLDALCLFYSGGLFTHSVDGGFSFSATSQALLALISLEKGVSVWDLFLSDENVGTTDTQTEPSDRSEAPSTTEPVSFASRSQSGAYKLPAVICVCAVSLTVCAVLFILKKRNPKNFIFVIVICALIVCLILFTNFSSVDDYYKSENVTAKKIGTVTLSVSCEKIVGRSDLVVWENGEILAPCVFDLYENDTVYDLLVRAAREKKLRLDLRGSYVAGIESIYELRFGELSGWIYHVNGVEAKYGCREYKLSDGDVVEWMYTLELGKDLLKNETA